MVENVRRRSICNCNSLLEYLLLDRKCGRIYIAVKMFLCIFVVRAAYLKAARQYHPDKASKDEKELHTKKFQILTKIVELLQNNDLRKSYDETGRFSSVTDRDHT